MRTLGRSLAENAAFSAFDIHARVATALLVIAVMLLTSSSCQQSDADSYQALSSARSEREQIDYVNRLSRTQPSEAQLSGVASYWMTHTDYVHDHPTLSVLLRSLLYENDYHSAAFQEWVIESLARHKDMSYRRAAWIFVCHTKWAVAEPRLQEAVELELEVERSGAYTDKQMIHDALGRTGRRLYPQASWWRDLIHSGYGK